MRVLLTNDDGVRAAGLAAVAEALSRIGISYEVVAPRDECSAVGHSISLRRPVGVERVDLSTPAGRRTTAYAVTGTPADCVKLAVTALFAGEPFDLLISGINPGPNIGINVFYSGTVAAALQGAIQGIPGIALSVGFPDGSGKPTYGRAAKIASEMVEALTSLLPLPLLPVWNINFPDESRTIEGFVLTRQSSDGFREYFKPVGDREKWPRTYALDGVYLVPKGDIHLDSVALYKGHISATPIGLDLTYPFVEHGETDCKSKASAGVIGVFEQVCARWKVPFIKQVVQKQERKRDG